MASRHRAWVEAALREARREREERWTESVAVGSRPFIEDAKRQLGRLGRSRVIAQVEGGYVLRETAESYGRDIAAQKAARR